MLKLFVSFLFVVLANIGAKEIAIAINNGTDSVTLALLSFDTILMSLIIRVLLEDIDYNPKEFRLLVALFMTQEIVSLGTLITIDSYLHAFSVCIVSSFLLAFLWEKQRKPVKKQEEDLFLDSRFKIERFRFTISWVKNVIALPYFQNDCFFQTLSVELSTDKHWNQSVSTAWEKSHKGSKATIKLDDRGNYVIFDGATTKIGLDENAILIATIDASLMEALNLM